MNIYLVGGAVRDELLGLPLQEKDWVVVGATVEEMLRQGFRQVGKDFPVFLHPKTHEEYALARQERKMGRGYTGFDFDVSPSVSLEEDLKRRDLTINAIAKTDNGVLIDPYHGIQDLQQKILRHVSPAFVEDPVRILRVARFAARFSHLGFTVAKETLHLMQTMVQSGEVDALVSERVWKEWQRALTEKNPEAFFAVLQSSGAQAKLFPMLDDAAIDSLISACHVSTDPCIRFAALCRGVIDVHLLCDRFRIPKEYRDLALLTARFCTKELSLQKLTAEAWLALLQSLDAFRRDTRFKKWLVIYEMIAGVSAAKKLMAIFLAAKKVDIQAIVTASGLSGSALADEIKLARVVAIRQLMQSSLEL